MPSLETMIMHNYGLRYIEARQMVLHFRKKLGLSKWGGITPELHDACFHECMSVCALGGEEEDDDDDDTSAASTAVASVPPVTTNTTPALGSFHSHEDDDTQESGSPEFYEDDGIDEAFYKHYHHYMQQQEQQQEEEEEEEEESNDLHPHDDDDDDECDSQNEYDDEHDEEEDDDNICTIRLDELQEVLRQDLELQQEMQQKQQRHRLRTKAKDHDSNNESTSQSPEAVASQANATPTNESSSEKHKASPPDTNEPKVAEGYTNVHWSINNNTPLDESFYEYEDLHRISFSDSSPDLCDERYERRQSIGTNLSRKSTPPCEMDVTASTQEINNNEYHHSFYRPPLRRERTALFPGKTPLGHQQDPAVTTPTLKKSKYHVQPVRSQPIDPVSFVNLVQKRGTVETKFVSADRDDTTVTETDFTDDMVFRIIEVPMRQDSGNLSEITVRMSHKKKKKKKPKQEPREEDNDTTDAIASMDLCPRKKRSKSLDSRKSKKKSHAATPTERKKRSKSLDTRKTAKSHDTKKSTKSSKTRSKSKKKKEDGKAREISPHRHTTAKRKECVVV